MKRIQPPYLQPSDKVGLVAPAGYVNKQQLQGVAALLQSWQLRLVLGKHLYAQWGGMAGTDKQRAADLQYMIDQPSVKAIIAVRGGYGCVRLLPYINFEPLKAYPKWLVGFSDITLLHNKMANLCIESLHATMPALWNVPNANPLSVQSLMQALCGQLEQYELHKAQVLRTGIAEGELIGGNLSVLYSLMATEVDIDFEGKILFIEEVGEYLYHIDRMLIALQLSGRLKVLKGLIIGGIDNIKANNTPFALALQELIWEKIKAYDYPVLIDFPAGHREPNLCLILGRHIRLEIKEDRAHIQF